MTRLSSQNLLPKTNSTKSKVCVYLYHPAQPGNAVWLDSVSGWWHHPASDGDTSRHTHCSTAPHTHLQSGRTPPTPPKQKESLAFHRDQSQFLFYLHHLHKINISLTTVCVCVFTDLIRTLTVSVGFPIIHQVWLVDDAYDQTMLDGGPSHASMTRQEGVTQLRHRHSRSLPWQHTCTYFIWPFKSNIQSKLTKKCFNLIIL